MIPYGDNFTQKGYSFGSFLIVLILCAINIPLFFSNDLMIWAYKHLAFVPLLFSVYPARYFHALITSTFVHEDIYHLLGNCLFLWVFGRSLERLFGILAYLACFPVLGVFGLLLQWLVAPDSTMFVIGSSGAIATLMGVYLTLFPRARIKLIFSPLAFLYRFSLPAWMFLFYWSGLQFLSFLSGAGLDDHVAYAVHVGGFFMGIIGAMVWKTAYPFAEERLETFTREEISPDEG